MKSIEVFEPGEHKILKIYSKFNERYFDNKLPTHPYIAYNQNHPKANSINETSWFDKPTEKSKDGIIFLSPFIISKGKQEEHHALLHEMIHQYIEIILFINSDHKTGDDNFVEIANKIGNKLGFTNVLSYTKESRAWPFGSLPNRLY